MRRQGPDGSDLLGVRNGVQGCSNDVRDCLRRVAARRRGVRLGRPSDAARKEGGRREVADARKGVRAWCPGDGSLRSAAEMLECVSV